MIDGMKEGLTMDCPMCSRELIRREILDGSGDMFLCSWVCTGTGYDCPLVSVMIWEDVPEKLDSCEHSDSAYESLGTGSDYIRCALCGNIKEAR